MKISLRILRSIQRDGPATAPELGAILFPNMRQRDAMRRCSAHLCNLRTDGKLKVIGKVQRNGHRGNKLMANLYNLAA